MPPLRVGVIGRGPWGRNIHRELLDMGQEIAFWADRRSGWSIDRDVDAVVVAAHPSIHPDVVRQASNRRIPVLLEKPAALSLAAAEKLVRADTRVLVDYTYLCDPDFVVWRSGLPTFGVARVDMTGRGPKRSVSGLYDYGSHALALAASLAGSEPKLGRVKRLWTDLGCNYAFEVIGHDSTSLVLTGNAALVGARAVEAVFTHTRSGFLFDTTSRAPLRNALQALLDTTPDSEPHFLDVRHASNLTYHVHRLLEQAEKRCENNATC